MWADPKGEAECLYEMAGQKRSLLNYELVIDRVMMDTARTHDMLGVPGKEGDQVQGNK